MSRVYWGLGAIDGHAHASSPAPGNCADGDDADDNAGACGVAGGHRSGLDSSIVAPNWSSRNAGHARCGVSGSASSPGWSKRSMDLANVFVSVSNLCNAYFLTVLACFVFEGGAMDSNSLFNKERYVEGRERKLVTRTALFA